MQRYCPSTLPHTPVCHNKAPGSYPQLAIKAKASSGHQSCLDSGPSSSQHGAALGPDHPKPPSFAGSPEPSVWQPHRYIDHQCHSGPGKCCAAQHSGSFYPCSLGSSFPCLLVISPLSWVLVSQVGFTDIPLPLISDTLLQVYSAGHTEQSLEGSLGVVGESLICGMNS